MTSFLISELRARFGSVLERCARTERSLKDQIRKGKRNLIAPSTEHFLIPQSSDLIICLAELN
jgi:hypothetical protein